jgi:broad specificity phosphatase PhoE
MTVVQLIRHAQASAGTSNYDRLSELGVSQARSLGAHLKLEPSPTVVACGEHRRHRDTVQHAGFGRPRIDPRWNEFDAAPILRVGAPHYMGEDPMEGWQQAKWRWASGQYDDDYPESFASFAYRCREAFDDTVLAAGAHGSVLVITSAGVIASIVTLLLVAGGDLWPKLQITAVNTAITRIVVGHSGATVIAFNEQGHVRPAQRTYT